MLGFKGPRKMTIVIPSMGVDHKRMPVQPKMVRVIFLLYNTALKSGRLIGGLASRDIE